MAIEILAYYEVARRVGTDRRIAAEINELVARQGRAELVPCSSIESGEALVLYTGAPEGDGVFSGPELDRELEAALLAKVEGR